MFYTYILFSELTNKYYVGSTGNIADRLERHNMGRSKATQSGIPWRLVYTECFDTRSEAYRREMEIKSWKSHNRISQLVGASRF
jgi:putative endonuclease